RARSLHRPLDDLFVGAHLVMTNHSWLLPGRDRKVEPPTDALFGLQRGSLQRRFLRRSIRANRASIGKMQLEKRRKREIIRRRIWPRANLHVGAHVADWSRPRDRVYRHHMSARRCLLLPESLSSRNAAEQNPATRSQSSRTPVSTPGGHHSCRAPGTSPGR